MRSLLIAPLALVAALAATPAEAQPGPHRPVALGVGAGLAIPSACVQASGSTACQDADYKLGFNWGFFVDIPLINTFHLTPSALVYRLSSDQKEASSSWNTDLSLTFKFVVPLGPLEPFAGVLAGMTAQQASLDPHVGLVGGLQVHVLSNVDAFAQLNYKVTLRDEGNLKDWQIYFGPLFRFE